MIESAFSSVLSIECHGLGKDAIIAAFASGLEAENWFGANFDALYDLLTDHKGRLTIDLIDWYRAELSPADRLAFESVFEDSTAEADGFLDIRVVSKRF